MRLSPAELAALVEGTETCPHRFLGSHPLADGGVVIRALFLGATSCKVLKDEASRGKEMAKLADLGVFELVYPKSPAFRYRFQVGYADGSVRDYEDPYRFLPTISEQDLFLIGKGDDHQVFHKLGSHVRTLDGVAGVSFAVWAPSARRVSVVGDHNHWNGRAHPMRSLGASGI